MIIINNNKLLDIMNDPKIKGVHLNLSMYKDATITQSTSNTINSKKICHLSSIDVG